MSNELLILYGIALSTGFLHTLFGPDHYVPFIALAKARKWNRFKTSVIVLLCGLGHVSSSIIIGLLGIAFGWTLSTLKAFESLRGEISGWLLIALGLTYLVWGIRHAYKNKPHEHIHYHSDEGFHLHEHKHKGEHSHIHQNENKHTTQWVLFLIFIFGPCEPLIPIVMYPAIKHDYFAVIIVSLLFSVATLIVMLSVTLLSLSGLRLVSFGKLERYVHIFASSAILICGIAVKFLGL